MLEAGEREPEVVEPVSEGSTSDRDPERARVGEVGEAKPAGLVLLAEDYVLLRPIERSPRADAPLQRAADVHVEIGMPPAQLIQNADHADARRCHQDRHDLAVPVRRQWIGPSPASRILLLRR